MRKLRIIFMGTSIFAVPALKALLETSHEIVGVVSQPDRPRGRGKQLHPTPVKEAALQYDLAVYQFARIKDTEAHGIILNLNPDLIVVASYGQIIPLEILNIPAMGCINVHASLLPRYRGAAPIQRAIMDGERKTGITIMKMDQGLDTGDILLQEQVDINADIDHGGLEQLLARMGAQLLLKAIDGLMQGSIHPQKQDDENATYAKMISREEERIDWSQPAWNIHNHIRGLCPLPGAYTIFKEERLKIFRSRIADESVKGEAGVITGITQQGFVVQTGEGSLEILEVQKQGKKRMAAREFIKGYSIDRQNRFDSREG